MVCVYIGYSLPSYICVYQVQLLKTELLRAMGAIDDLVDANRLNVQPCPLWFHALWLHSLWLHLLWLHLL